MAFKKEFDDVLFDFDGKKLTITNLSKVTQVTVYNVSIGRKLHMGTLAKNETKIVSGLSNGEGILIFVGQIKQAEFKA